MIQQQFAKDNQDLQKIVLAGQKIMFDPKVFDQFKEGLMREAPISDNLALESAGLIKLIDDKVQGNLPKHIVVPAAIVLMAEMAKFMKESGMGDPTEEDVQLAIKKLLILIANIYGGGQQNQTEEEQAENEQVEGPPEEEMAEGEQTGQPQPTQQGLLQQPMGV